MDQNVHIIAEAGTNHNGNPETALRLVEAAHTAGADSIKFQIIYPEGLYLPEFYRPAGYERNEVYEKRARTMLPDSGYRQAAQRSRELGMGMSASIFDNRGLTLLQELDPPYIKLASCDLNNHPLLRFVAKAGRKVIISTGMSELQEIRAAVAAIEDTGNRDLVIMHCVSVYPCPVERMNLGFIRQLQDAFSYPIGLSDHSESSLAAAMAVGMGVRWFEKHFTLNRNQEGFDHPYAMEPAALGAYIADIKTCVAACAQPSTKLGDAESGVKTRARRSVYAARDIEAGETLTPADLLVVRPEGPIPPADAPKIAGSKAKRRIFRYEAMDWEALG